MSKLIRNKKKPLKAHHIGILRSTDRLSDVQLVNNWEYRAIKAWNFLQWFAYGLFGITVCLLSAIAFEPIVRWLLEGAVSMITLLAIYENATVGMP
jgi:hypothetical protein